VKTFSKNKDKKLLFQTGGIENAELHTGISCGPIYQGINSTKPIPIQLRKTPCWCNPNWIREKRLSLF